MRLTHRQDDVLRRLLRARGHRLNWINLHERIGRSRGTVMSLQRRDLVDAYFRPGTGTRVVALTGWGIITARAAEARWRKGVAQWRDAVAR